MSILFEQPLALDRAEMMARVLAKQTEAFGYIDFPVLSHALEPFGEGSVLDIGTGEGSFLGTLAARHPDVRFVGLEPNAPLLTRARTRIRDLALRNVRLDDRVFDADYEDTHDVILARFTLQHVREPQGFIRAIYRALNPGGLFVCIEPVYDYYDGAVDEAVWRAFREKMLATYQQWGSHPNVPKWICPILADAGFTSIRATLHLYSPITIGHERFAAVVLAAATMLHHEQPAIWEAAYLERLAQWIQKPASDPFAVIAHIQAFKGSEPSV